MTHVTLKTIYDLIQDFRTEVKDTYVTKAEFSSELSPIKSIVYGMVGLALTAVFIAVLAGVIKAQ